VIVEGFEAWIATERGPSVISGAVFDGSPSECPDAIDDYSARLSDWDVYFVLFTKTGTTGPAIPLSVDWQLGSDGT
jgi:hypothetical protein